jgi:hypothetical protein
MSEKLTQKWMKMVTQWMETTTQDVFQNTCEYCKLLIPIFIHTKTYTNACAFSTYHYVALKNQLAPPPYDIK